MAEDSKGFIGSEAPRREGSINIGQNTSIDTGTVENKRDQSGDQKVGVKALKMFPKHGHDVGGEMVQPGDEFDTHRQRASELRANGLIEYKSESDAHAAHGPDGAKKLDEKLRLEADMRKIPANSRATPLVNPKVDMAEAPTDAQGKRR
jgi:hypothetical protein